VIPWICSFHCGATIDLDGEVGVRNLFRWRSKSTVGGAFSGLPARKRYLTP
jgi:hypothetical protein